MFNYYLFNFILSSIHVECIYDANVIGYHANSTEEFWQTFLDKFKQKFKHYTPIGHLIGKIDQWNESKWSWDNIYKRNSIEDELYLFRWKSISIV